MGRRNLLFCLGASSFALWHLHSCFPGLWTWPQWYSGFSSSPACRRQVDPLLGFLDSRNMSANSYNKSISLSLSLSLSLTVCYWFCFAGSPNIRVLHRNSFFTWPMSCQYSMVLPAHVVSLLPAFIACLLKPVKPFEILFLLGPWGRDLTEGPKVCQNKLRITDPFPSLR